MDKKNRVSRIAKVVNIKPAGTEHQVVSVASTGGSYRKKPCPTCPWRKDATGVFPAEAFRHSAPTAYDMAEKTFACHASGVHKPAVCAGFLLRGADHNYTVRRGYITGRFSNDVYDAGLDLYSNYREMAIANGVSPDDPVIQPCRDD